MTFGTFNVGVLVASILFLPIVVLAATDSFTIKQLYGTDTDAPSAPALLTATPLSTSQIDLSWSAATDMTSYIVGYKVFRNVVQIATTTLLTYSDIGLTPSTTYTYHVQSFDVFGNISTSSASVSTTTFATPVVPVDPVATSTGSSAGMVMAPRLMSVDVDSGTESARFVFSLTQPATYVLRYGLTDSVSDGFVQSDIFKREHSTILEDLKPSTQYFYELYITDRFGRETLLKRGDFKTLSLYTLPPIPNVSFFTAITSGQNVLLSWGNPNMDAFAYVRVVRNHYYYPQNPTDGVVIYEGVGVSFYDEAALNQYDRQYYTIFAYNIDGVPSSGAVAAAARDQVVTEAPAVPGVEVPTTVATSAEAFRLTFADVTVVQNDELIAASAETMVLKADTPFMIRVPVAMVPGAAKTVIVTWQHPFDSMKTTSYLLKRNAEGTYYEAIAAPIADTGIYPLHVAVFDAATNMLGSVSGTFEIFRSDVAPEASGQSIAYIATTYIIVGGIIGLCTVLGLWWIFVTLLRLLFRKK